MSDDSTARSVGNAPGHVSRDAYSRSRWIRYFSALGVVILIVIAVFVAPALLNAYDAARHAWISCDVNRLMGELVATSTELGLVVRARRLKYRRRTAGRCCFVKVLLRQTRSRLRPGSKKLGG